MASDSGHLVLHVGYHKTGSSWLQRTLWADATAGFVQPWPVRAIRDAFVRVHPFRFDPEAAAAAHDGIEEATAAGLIPVLADERLSGHPHAGGFDGRDVADRLAAAFPGARVVVVVREQRAVVLLCWKQYVKTGGPMPLRRYLTPPIKGWDRIPLFRFSHFEYDRLISHYQGAFGLDRVLVLTFEQVPRDPDGYVERLTTFAGGRPPFELVRGAHVQNPSTSVLASDLKRRTHWLVARDATNPVTLVDRQDLAARATRMTNAVARRCPSPMVERREEAARQLVAEACAGRYAASNRRAAELTGLDLASLGYET